MIVGKSIRNVTIAIILVISLVGFHIPMSTSTTSVWIVNADVGDFSTDLAVNTLERELGSVGISIMETSMMSIQAVPLNVGVLILIGHGQPDGIEIGDSIQPWDVLYRTIAERKPQKTVILACNSPTNKSSNVFGFRGQIDAEAGAFLASLHVFQSYGINYQKTALLDQIIQAQNTIQHPLESYLYFVHGYFGSDDQFQDMINTLTDWDVDDRYDGFRTFSYWQPYWDLYQGMYDTWDDFMHEMHFGFTISDYAYDFMEYLINAHQNEGGVQIDIVAHSMGGLITRELLRLYRPTLNEYDIDFGRIATIGTPHEGTQLAVSGISSILRDFLEVFFNSQDWDSPVFSSMAPDSPFLSTLNADPLSYMGGIGWFTIAGEDTSAFQSILWFVHYDVNDQIVANGRAQLSFALHTLIHDCDHSVLIDDPQERSYSIIENWFLGGRDADNDGLLDVEENLRYHTSPTNDDTDNDGLTDGEEVLIYGSNPLSINTDGDAINDAQEVDWGYSPTNPNDPIPASSLVSNAWQSDGITGYVRANHYSAMDYVKIYVKYKDGTGHWTSYSYVGSDDTPYYSGDYYVTWSIPQGYVQMCVKAQAYDSSDHYLGCDTYYVSLPSGGGTPKPPPPPI